MASKRKDKVRCRLCCDFKEESETGPLIKACNCKGLLAFVHERCIAQWLESSLMEHCDFCNFKFKMEKEHQTFFDWLKIEEEERNDMIVIVVIACLTLYFLIVGSVVNYYTVTNAALTLSYIIWFLIIFWFILISVYMTLYVLRQRVVFGEWKESHFRISVKAIAEEKSAKHSASNPTEVSELRQRKTENSK